MLPHFGLRGSLEKNLLASQNTHYFIRLEQLNAHHTAISIRTGFLKW